MMPIRALALSFAACNAILGIDPALERGDAASDSGDSSDTTDGAVDGMSDAGPAHSCRELHRNTMLSSGVYAVMLDAMTMVYCDMDTDDGGWTLAAVCHAADGGNCWVQSAVGSTIDPKSATTTKLSDSRIQLLLSQGDGLTRGWWRQSTRHGITDPLSAAVFDHLDDPMEWSSSECMASDPSKAFEVKYASTNSIVDDMGMTALSNQAYGMPFSGTLASMASGCSCGANGWSNAEVYSCGLAAWTAVCELGPSMSHDCTTTPAEERADVVLWIR